MTRALFIPALAFALGACATTRPSAEPTGLLGADIPEIEAALASGETSSLRLTAAYIERIRAIDWAGPKIQAVLAINPGAEAEAEASDARRAAGKSVGPLDGVPVLIKDNIETKDPMATTAGSLALSENVTGRDSPLVAGLRSAGAVILGKTNLSEWANFRSNSSNSGWSGAGGQVKNPHMLDRNPCGSSSGSGAGVAASLAPAAIGTETNGSIICPSNVNGLVGFKPTVGLVSQQFIVPISSSQDTAGPMAKSVKSAAILLNAMATREKKTDYVAALNASALKGVRIGVARWRHIDDPNLAALFERALFDLKKAGAELVDIKEFETPAGFDDASFTVLKYEFKATLNTYLANAAPAVTARSLADIIAFNNAHMDRELALFDQSIMDASVTLGDLNSPEYKTALALVQKATRQDGIDMLLAKYDVAALVAPSGPFAPRIDAVNGDVWPQFPGIGSMAAIAGYPHATVPMGSFRALPAGLSFIGAKDDDARILSFAYAYEHVSHARIEPHFLKGQDDLPDIKAALGRPQ